MKKIILILVFPLLCNISFGQNKVAAEKLVDEGVAYHNKGNYEGALSKYNMALELDRDNLLALIEKSSTLLSLKKYDESISNCKKAIAVHPNDNALPLAYAAYGKALDGSKNAEKSLEIYNEGIKLFPDSYLLHFNKGITLSNLKKNKEALLCLQKAVLLNPKHASSHNAIARLSNLYSMRVPSLLAFCRFLTLESQGKIAKENLASMLRIIDGNITRSKTESNTIIINPEIAEGIMTNKELQENTFTNEEVVLAMNAVLGLDKMNKKKMDIKNFTRSFETICTSLKEKRRGSSGFFWTYYVPYFVEMKDKKWIETFAYIAFSSSQDPDAVEWLKSNKSATDKFFEWSNAFEWKTD
jgi:tetratricopeptide (TPR) repeat protein